jgi:hypothetical protein
MTVTNDFILFGSAATNIDSQSTYAGAGTTTNGRSAGICASSTFNKMMRQGTCASAALGSLINTYANQNATDNGNLTTFVNNLITALQTIQGVSGKFLFASGTLSGGSLDLSIPSDAQEVEIELNDPAIASGSAVINMTYKVGGSAVSSGYNWASVTDSTTTVTGNGATSASAWPITATNTIGTGSGISVTLKVRNLPSGTKFLNAAFSSSTAVSNWVNGNCTGNTGVVSDIVLAPASSSWNGGGYRAYKIK